MSKSVCFYFQVHQPFRLDTKSVFEDESNSDVFGGDGEFKTHTVFEKVAQKCYLPMTNLLLELLTRYPDFRVSFSLSGVFLEQCETYGDIGDAVLTNFQRLANTGQVEFLAETYHHSFSFLHSKSEFARQVQLHNEKIYKLLGVKPRIFRNTELMYSNELAEFVRQLGFTALLAEGCDTALPFDSSPNHVWTAKQTKLNPYDIAQAQKFIPVNFFGFRRFLPKKIKVLSKNQTLSQNISVEFGDKKGGEYPLTPDNFADLIDTTSGETINLFMDLETFGKKFGEETGIFEFFRYLPRKILKKGMIFRTPSETIRSFKPQGEFSSCEIISWGDQQKDISPWLGNSYQRSAFEEVIGLEKHLQAYSKPYTQKTQEIWNDFRKLQTSNHFEYMSDNISDSPYDSPYDAFLNYMTVLDVLKRRIVKKRYI